MLEIENILQSIAGMACHGVFFCCDFNFNLLGMASDAACLNFVNTMFSHFLSPAITKPTRIADNSYTLIDNIFMSHNAQVHTGVMPCDFSDHCLIFVSVNDFFSYSHVKPKLITYRLLNNFTISNFYNSINFHDFSSIVQCDEVDSGIAMLDCAIMHYFNIHRPVITKTVSYKNFLKPWIDGDTRAKIKKRSNYYILYKLGRMSRSEFNRYRNMVTSEIRTKKKLYYERKLREFGSDMRKSWRLINQLINCNGKQSNTEV